MGHGFNSYVTNYWRVLVVQLKIANEMVILSIINAENGFIQQETRHLVGRENGGFSMFRLQFLGVK